jgi:hypothetical protein
MKIGKSKAENASTLPGEEVWGLPSVLYVSKLFWFLNLSAFIGVYRRQIAGG